MDLWGAISTLTGIEVERLVSRLRRNAVAISVVALLLLTAFVALLVSADLALATLVGPIYAPLIIAGVALFLALIAYLVMAISQAARRRREEKRRRELEAGAAFTSAALAGLPALLKSPLLRKYGIPAAVVAAIVLLGLGERHDE